MTSKTISAEQYDTKISKILDVRNEIESDIWRKRMYLRVFEISAFLGMFLIKDPVFYMISVFLAALALAIDFYLSFKEHESNKRFEYILQ